MTSVQALFKYTVVHILYYAYFILLFMMLKQYTVYIHVYTLILQYNIINAVFHMDEYVTSFSVVND